MGALVLRHHDGVLASGAFRFTPAGMVVDGDPTFADWSRCGEFLQQAAGRIQWWVGDWLNYGESKWGETYTQAVDATGLDYQTVANAKWVSGRFDVSCRRETLSFSHHLEVASLPVEQAESLLDEAESEGLSTRDLRARVRGIKSAPRSDAVRFSLILESQAIWAWLESRRESWPAEHRGQFFAVARSVLTNMEGEFRDG